MTDYGGRADCSLHFYEGVIGKADQDAFTAALFAVFAEVLPA